MICDFSYEFLIILDDFQHSWQESVFFFFIVVTTIFTSYKILEAIWILHGFPSLSTSFGQVALLLGKGNSQNQNEADWNLGKNEIS